MGNQWFHFLKLCIVNGRICPLNDNYTYVSVKGKAVVDYILAPYECLQTCNFLEVLTPIQPITAANCIDLIENGKKCRIPDYFFIVIKVSDKDWGSFLCIPRVSNTITCTKKKVCRTLPDNFLSSGLQQWTVFSNWRMIYNSILTGKHR